ncbi:hypothetical protein GBAR_LOCUS8828 [Geodia barretti]|uniref:Uncharacterized protein n=1 Tax=Geodia barretti TaxID=519541 RepID=A0AA35RM41_GEOBA|nr:hypothetical protein GBAR_LOCUS8828 [Geodia barretti]
MIGLEMPVTIVHTCLTLARLTMMMIGLGTTATHTFHLTMIMTPF